MRYLIWSNEHRGWWKPNRHGYTTNTMDAGRFHSAEARDICNEANRYAKADAPEEIMVAAPSVDQCMNDLLELKAWLHD